MIADAILESSRRLSDAVGAMSFAEPVTHVYNPLDYAWKSYASYVKRFATGTKKAVFLGMNPGPFGMAQTGVPFGEIAAVRDWMGIEEEVGQPPELHPKRPIQGFECPRSEVSGRRLWGWAQERYKTAEAFFEEFYVINYCPLVFMEGPTGRNRVPEKLKKEERDALFEVCDLALREMVEVLKPDYVVGVGKWPRVRAEKALPDFGGTFGNVLHPSPANPWANKGWAERAEVQLKELTLI